MNGMGTPKDIILMLILIIGVISMTAFVTSLKVGERMDKSIAAMNSKNKKAEDPQTMKYTAIALLTIAVGVSILFVLKQFDVITDTFFPYYKQQ